MASLSGWRLIVDEVSSGLPVSGRNQQWERIARGGLATSTETRLKELTRWGGFSSFFTPSGFAAGESVGVHPVGQVVGLAAGELRSGYVRVSDRWKLPVVSGTARHFGDEVSDLSEASWQEHPQVVRDWDHLRRLALGRLVKQAKQLGCQAVVGVEPRRDLERGVGGEAYAVLQFSGTAVRVDGWAARKTQPVLALGSVNEVSRLLTDGIEPVGIVGGVGRIELQPSKRTIKASRRTGMRMASTELVDLTYAVYEARRAAMSAAQAEAGALGATGVLDVRLDLDRHGQPTQQFASVVVTAHALGLAVRRTNAAMDDATPARFVVDLSGQPDG